MTCGTVYLVGAGPGDPGLLTLKGKLCLERADVVFYDALVGGEILEHCRPGTELHFVGKRAARHSIPQSETNRLLVEAAREGKTVVRLKGGDPLVFARGGEEAECLAREGIRFEIVPGVSSALAAPAHAGIPITHRAHSSSVRIITGHEDPDKDDSMLNWANIAADNGTLIFLMGMENLARITARLIKEGKNSATPVACIRYGSRPDQSTVTGTLENIARKVEQAGLSSPAAIVVGTVVELRDLLNWFETRPLFGRRILITRTRRQAGELSRRLEDLGAWCLSFPVIRIEPPEDYGPLDRALRALSAFNWMVFTSANTIPPLLERLKLLDLDLRALAGVKLAAIGPATRDALMSIQLKVDLMPEEFTAEGLAAAFAPIELQGQAVLIPRAQEARDVLPRVLEDRAARVEVVAAYRTLPNDPGAAAVREMLEAGEVDFITFASSSTVRHYHDLVGSRIAEGSGGAKVVCIGPVTAATARGLGYRVDAMPATYTIPALVEALLDLARADSSTKA